MKAHECMISGPYVCAEAPLFINVMQVKDLKACTLPVLACCLLCWCLLVMLSEPLCGSNMTCHCDAGEFSEGMPAAGAVCTVCDAGAGC